LWISGKVPGLLMAFPRGFIVWPKTKFLGLAQGWEVSPDFKGYPIFPGIWVLRGK